MKVTFMGTGTSHGIPVIGCKCPVCMSTDPKDKRMRCSILISTSNDKSSKQLPITVIIDTGPEFRLQAIQHNLTHLDAVFYTHSHADHMNGLDDLRIFSHTNRPNCSMKTNDEPLCIYANKWTIEDISKRFDYAFCDTTEGGGIPKLSLIDCAEFSSTNPIVITRSSGHTTPCKNLSRLLDDSSLSENQTTIQSLTNNPGNTENPNDTQKNVTEKNNQKLYAVPIPMMHGHLGVSGWLFYENPNGKKLAYLTDCSSIPESSINAVKGVEHLIIDGLRISPHPTHFSFSQALEVAAKISPRHVWLTHICHDYSYVEINNYLAKEKAKYPSLTDVNADTSSCNPQVIPITDIKTVPLTDSQITVMSAYDGQIITL